MKANFYLWGMGIGIAVILGFVAWCWWPTREPKSKRDPDTFASTKDVASCGGCGCLLLKGPQFKQPSSVGLRVESIPCGMYGYLYEPVFKEAVKEHYLCLRCQVDGTPPAKMVEAIDEARAAAGEKPC